MEKLFNFCGGRKTTFALLLFIAVTVFLFLNKCDFTGWSNFIIWVFGSYALGNSIEHVGKALKKGK
jgi:hypothetical protein